ncbi:MAG TPA: leucyl/phenylalanyl-tRNA--protein transferase [Paenalcaligenes hominis]|uniref:Leucyl/phenylalanyl-tRNA--protein transferase n=1 Tax=Paenalcaligenes hominis TaxID=643674 RepID=A0A9D3AC40_9BURK|nr:leucyl/phenylalanyl-tRNA--protein transferase [Paenalcaligenes hominis]HJH24844.1 leucyl/phenylalanyl-tRNA--protein transferase [Paenalcaligenes hominis]
MPLISIPWIDAHSPFPSVEMALSNGLVAAGADLSIPRLLNAYRHGLFPWFNEGEPILWWSPDPRTVLRCDQFKLSKSLAKRCRQLGRDELGPNPTLRVTTNMAFLQVIQQCAQTRRHKEGTWISSDIIHAYYNLHLIHHAHSIEVWQGAELVGGLYGVRLGQFFFGESMFSLINDASKIALYYLTRYLLTTHAIQYIDCQQETAHLLSLGATPIPRTEFSQLLATLTSADTLPWGQGQLCAQGLLYPAQ